MKLLIDSSTNFLLIGIVNNNQILTFYREGRNDHSETLVDYLNKFFIDNNLNIDDVKEVYVGRGPGSYTGLRIAGVVLKVFSFTKDIPLYSFSSLDLLMCSVKSEGLYLALTEAKKTSSYYKAFKYDGKYQILSDEGFKDNVDLFSEYPNYEHIIISEELIKDNLKDMFLNILNNQLFIKESNLDYTPNYIRSGI